MSDPTWQPDPRPGAPADPSATGAPQPRVQYLPPVDPPADWNGPTGAPEPTPAGPSAAASEARGGMSPATIIAIVSSSLVVILLFVIAGLGARVFGESALGSTPPPEHLADSAVVVEDYLQALADGDAALARDLAGGDSVSPLLTQESLDRSRAIGAVSDIVVEADDIGWGGNAAHVRATFSVGDREVGRTFHLRDEGGEWRLLNGTLQASLYSLSGLEVELNGIRMTGEEVRLFPGAYEVAVQPEQFRVSQWDGEVVIASTADADSFSAGQIEVSAAGDEEFRELVADEVEACLELRSLETPCGMALEDDGTLGDLDDFDGKVIRELTPQGEATLERLRAEPDYVSDTSVTSYDSIEYVISIDAEKGSAASFEQFGVLDAPRVDFGTSVPEVNWTFL